MVINVGKKMAQTDRRTDGRQTMHYGYTDKYCHRNKRFYRVHVCDKYSYASNNDCCRWGAELVITVRNPHL